MKIGMVSVIIPFFRAGRFAERLVRCLQSQQYRNFDVIFVDDGNGEGVDILQSELGRLNVTFEYKILSTSGKLGPGGARNLGLENTEGQYVAFLDSDDLWPKEYLRRAVEELEKSKQPLIAFSSCYLDENFVEINRSILPEKICFQHILQTCPISLPGVVLDRNEIGDIRFNLRGHEDFQLWLHLLSSGICFKCVPDLCVYVTRISDSFSSNKFKAIRWQWLALRDFSDCGFIPRLIFMLVYGVNAILKRSQKQYKPKYLPDFIVKRLIKRK